jgi:hypothetical protein
MMIVFISKLSAIRVAIFGVAMLSISACVGNHVKADHTIFLNNAGNEDVHNFQVTYGNFSFPRTPIERFDHGGGGSYTMTIPIPETATVSWTTVDTQYREVVEIRRHVEGKPWFDETGKIVFEVDGGTLRVFLVRELPNFREESTQIR